MERTGDLAPDKAPQRGAARGKGLRLAVLMIMAAALLIIDPGNRSNPAQAQQAVSDANMAAIIAQTGPNSEEAYFKFDYRGYPETFIFKTTDPAIIQEARDILSGQQPTRKIMGTIIKQPAIYNPPWSYHLDPASIAFFDNAIEVCDATIQAVEARLDQVCGSFLPGCTWCPWGSQLIAEVRPLIPRAYLPIIVRD